MTKNTRETKSKCLYRTHGIFLFLFFIMLTLIETNILLSTLFFIIGRTSLRISIKSFTITVLEFLFLNCAFVLIIIQIYTHFHVTKNMLFLFFIFMEKNFSFVKIKFQFYVRRQWKYYTQKKSSPNFSFLFHLIMSYIVIKKNLLTLL